MSWLKIAAVSVVVGAAGCTTFRPEPNICCLIYDPISVSVKDSEETKRLILKHNELHLEVCDYGN